MSKMRERSWRTWKGGGMRRLALLLVLLLAAVDVARGDNNDNNSKNCSFDAYSEHLSCEVDPASSLAGEFSAGSASRARRVSVRCRSGDVSSVLRADQFGDLPGLRELDLVGCAVAKIPSRSFVGLSGLTRLTIAASDSSGQSSTELERDALAGLNGLRTLNLSGNSLWTMPEGALCSLSGLNVLNLSSNHLQDLDELGFAASEVNSCRLPLVEVDLSGNGLARLPAGGFGQLRKVERLDLSRNGLNVVDDDAFRGLELLQTLDLSGNNLVALPATAFSSLSEDDGGSSGGRCCQMLRELNLQNNSLSGLAPDLFSGLEHLLVLNLSRNEIDNDWLEDGTFSSLVRLVALDLSHNRLTGLSRSLLSPLTSLQLLDLSHNRLSTVPDGAFLAMHNLHILRLSHNLVETLQEDSLTGLSVLGSLSLDHNRLKHLDPEAMKKCSGLVDLELQHNKFESVPSSALKQLASLKTLDIGENRISNLTGHSLEGLRTVYALRLAGNGIKTLNAEDFKKVPNLRVLNLSRNRIRKLDQGAFKELGQLRMLRLDSNDLDDINGILSGQTELRWLNVSSNRLQWFDYAFIPKSLQWIDISHNNVEELGNYYKMEDGFSLTSLTARGNRIKKLEPLSLLGSLEQVHLADNKIKAVLPSTFEDKANLTKVDLSGNLLRRLQLPSLAVDLSPGRDRVPEVLLGGNPFFCNCEMEWLLKVNRMARGQGRGRGKGGSRYPTVGDLADISCRMADRSNRSRVLVRPLTSMRPEQFLCQYQAHCFALCNCCDFFACDCRMQCPHGCSCYHDSTWSNNVIQCTRRKHSSIPPLIPMDATTIYMDGNNLTGRLESQAFIGRKKVRELYLNHSKIEAINNQTFNGLTDLEVLHLDHNLIHRLEGYELQNLTSLRFLYLQSNRLTFIHEATFRSLASLEVLDLQDNLLTSYPVWDLAAIPSLVQVYLARNTWSCACDYVQRFQDFAGGEASPVTDLEGCECVANGGDTRVNLADNVTCSDAMAVTYRDVDKRPLLVGGDLVAVVVGAAAAVLVLCGILLVLVVFRTPVRVWLHSKYGVRVMGCCCCGAAAKSGQHDKLYDAFVSYSSKDDDFVRQVLLPQLEDQEPSYKLCLQHRDLPGNSTLADAFPGVSRLCAKHLLVISRPYLEGEWRQVRFALREESTKRLDLVLVLLEDLSSLELAADPELASLIKTSPSVRWSEPGFWNKMRFYLPDPRLRAYKRNLGGQSTVLRGAGGGEDGGGSSRGPSPKLLQQQQQQQQQHGGTVKFSSGWHYDGILGNNSSASSASTRSTSANAGAGGIVAAANATNSSSPRTLSGGSTASSHSSTAEHNGPSANILSNPLHSTWQQQKASPLHLQQPQEQHHTYQTIGGENSSNEPIYHTLEPSPSPCHNPVLEVGLEQFDTLGRLDVMLPNGQFVPATLVRNHQSGRLMPLVEVNAAASSTLPPQQQQREQQQQQSNFGGFGGGFERPSPASRKKNKAAAAAGNRHFV